MKTGPYHQPLAVLRWHPYRLVFVALLLPVMALAQPPAIIQISKSTSLPDLKKHLYALAGPQLEGRRTGSHGDTLAAQMVAGWFRQCRLEAPYEEGKNYYQPVDLNQVVMTKNEVQSNGTRYQHFDDWYVFIPNTYQSISLENTPVVFGGYGITSGTYDDLSGVDIRGRAVIIMQAQEGDHISALLAGADPAGVSADFLKNCALAGAAAVLIATGDFTRSAAALRRASQAPAYRNASVTVNPLPRLYISEKMANDLLSGNDITLQALRKNIADRHHPLSFVTKRTIGIDIRIDSVRTRAPNVIGIIRGSDSSAGAVVMSAHHDHLGKIGGRLYYGAADNASGTAALMEVARLTQRAVAAGHRPKRTIVFASFTGEEQGLLGAYYFTEHPAVPLEDIRADYNIDMLGRVDTFYSGRVADSNYLYYLYRDTLGFGLHEALVNANATVGLTLDDRYQQSASSIRRLTGSDQYPFYRKGISILRTDCGFAAEYHQPGDTPDKINYPLLTRQTQLAFLTLWNIADR